MYTGMAPTSLFDWTTRWPFAGSGAQTGSFAPNPGWTFGNIVINSTNSSAPGVEQAVVSRHSYGRQLGRLIEAVEAIVVTLPLLEHDTRIKAFQALAREIKEVKEEVQSTRLDRLREELQQLKASDPRAWREIVKPG